MTAAACLGFGVPAFAVMIASTVLEFKKNVDKRNDAILFSGLGALIFALTYSVMVVTSGDVREFAPILFFMAVPQSICAVYLFTVYAVHARLARRLSKCLSLIKNDHITSLVELGMILGLREKKIKKSVLRLIRAGRLPGASVDEANGEILFTESIWAKQRFICRNCGAELTVDFGHTLVCEYCGQALPISRN